MRLRLAALPLALLLACSKTPQPATPPPVQPALKSPQGAACAAAADCATGFCVDQVCCQAGCGATEVCNDLQHVGICFARGPGAACGADAACPGGHCVDGVCCERACGQGESCKAPGFVGQCHGKALGEACAADGDCPSGHCADGVCCDAACVGPCLSCSQAGSVGLCQAAEDGTDPRQACARCEGCFSGACAPALPGTDPNQACGAGQTCTAAQSCATATGGACSQDADCAQNSCIGGACLPVREVPIFAPPMNSTATVRQPQGLATGLGVRTFALFTETTLDQPYDPFQDQTQHVLEVALRVAAPDPAGGWRVSTLQRDTCSDYYDYTPSALVALGPTAYAVAYSEVASFGYSCALQPATVPAGVYGALLGPAGDPAGYESIAPGVRRPRSVSAGVGARGAVLAAFVNQDPALDDGGTPLEVWERTLADGGFAWVARGPFSNDAASLAVAQGQPPAMVWVDRDGGYFGDPAYLQARRLGDPAATPVPLQAGGSPICCEQPVVVPAASAPGAAGAFVLYCRCTGAGDGFYLGRVTDQAGQLTVALSQVPGSSGVSDVSALALPDGGALFTVVDYAESEVALGLAGAAQTHPVAQAGPGRTLRDWTPLAPGAHGEALMLVGRAATAAGAGADLGLVHLGP